MITSSTNPSTTRTVLRLSMVAGALAAVTAASLHPAQAAPATSTPAASTAAVSARLAGADRYGTAVAISRHQFPTSAASVYLVNGAAGVDAISAGMVGDGPILLVPGSGPIPSTVTAEIRRLAPKRVVAIGGTGVIPSTTLGAAAQGRPTARLAGADRYTTAAAVARAVYQHSTPSGDHASYFVNGTTLADAVVAGALASPYEPIFPLPATGTAPAAIRAAAAETNGGYALAIGGPRVLSDATFASATQGMVRGRRYGADRYATSVVVADNGRPAPATVYLAGGSGPEFADALAGGTLTRGPIVLVPKTGAIPQSVAAYLAKVRPSRVVALGGTGVISDAMLRTAQNAASGRMPTRDVRLPNPYTSKDQLRPGWTVAKQAAASGELTCDYGSPSALVGGTYHCGGTVHSADACFAKPGYPDVVTCIYDPWTKRLGEYRVNGPLPTTGPAPASDLAPLGVELGGTHCRLRVGGAWGGRGESYNPWAGCGEGPSTALWTALGSRTIDRHLDGSTWQYLFGPWDTSVPLQWKDATTRYYLG